MKKKITSLLIITVLSLSQAFPVLASENVIDTETEFATEIEWDKPATWEVTIPELSMDALNATGTGTVSVIADLLGNSFLKVTASPTVTMTQEGKPEVIADVTMTKTKWSAQEAAVTPVTSTVTMVARTPLSAGVYTGTLSYTVDLITAEEIMGAVNYTTIGDTIIDGNYAVYDARQSYSDILNAKYGSTANAKCDPTQPQWLWTTSRRAEYFPNEPLAYDTLTTQLNSWGASYDSNDVITLALGHDVMRSNTSPMSSYMYYAAERTAIKENYSSLQTDIIATMNVVLNKQTELGIDAPVIFIKRDFQYTTLDSTRKNLWNAAFTAPAVASVMSNPNVIFIDAKDILLATDYEDNGFHYKQSGHDKIATTIETKLIEYYSK